MGVRASSADITVIWICSCVGDFAKCVHILKHDLDYAWKSNVCFLTGCQKAELVSEEGDLVEVFGYVERRIEYDLRAYCSPLKHRLMLSIPTQN